MNQQGQQTQQGQPQAPPYQQMHAQMMRPPMTIGRRNVKP